MRFGGLAIISIILFLSTAHAQTHCCLVLSPGEVRKKATPGSKIYLSFNSTFSGEVGKIRASLIFEGLDWAHSFSLSNFALSPDQTLPLDLAIKVPLEITPGIYSAKIVGKSWIWNQTTSSWEASEWNETPIDLILNITEVCGEEGELCCAEECHEGLACIDNICIPSPEVEGIPTPPIELPAQLDVYPLKIRDKALVGKEVLEFILIRNVGRERNLSLTLIPEQEWIWLSGKLDIISPGDSSLLNVLLGPFDEAGEYYGRIVIESNGGRREIEIELDVVEIPSPEERAIGANLSIDLPDLLVIKGFPMFFFFKVRNSGNLTLHNLMAVIEAPASIRILPMSYKKINPGEERIFLLEILTNFPGERDLSIDLISNEISLRKNAKLISSHPVVSKGVLLQREKEKLIKLVIEMEKILRKMKVLGYDVAEAEEALAIANSSFQKAEKLIFIKNSEAQFLLRNGTRALGATIGERVEIPVLPILEITIQSALIICSLMATAMILLYLLKHYRSHF
jgi:hypothetical protein